MMTVIGPVLPVAVTALIVSKETIVKETASIPPKYTCVAFEK